MSRVRRRAGRVFVDTHGLIALVNADDAHHDETSRVKAECVDRRVDVMTSDWVLAEFLSACARRPLRAAACAVIRDLQASALATITPADRDTWTRAYHLFARRRDKDWSLIDCTTMVLCDDHGVSEVLTHDHHFTQAGLKILIP